MKLATREAVAGAAAALVAQGKKPTTEAVRAAIGGGSMRDVGGYLKEWREAQAAAAAKQAAEAAAERAAPDVLGEQQKAMAAELSKLLADGLQSLWEAAQ